MEDINLESFTEELEEDIEFGSFCLFLPVLICG